MSSSLVAKRRRGGLASHELFVPKSVLLGVKVFEEKIVLSTL
jgi:hypothetical protein